MKKNSLAAGALAFAVSITACGCGDQIYEMTNEEEAVVVHYAAHAVTKFNKKQSEGVKNVALLKALQEQRKQEAEKKQEEQKPEQSAEQEQQEQQSPDDTKTAADSGQTQTPDAGPQVDDVSLKKALGLKEVNAVYRSYELVSAYQASQSYMVRAGSGNELLVLHVNLRNGGSKTADCDILSKMPSFRLTINGELSANADTTILLNDLGTYQGRIQAGEKIPTVLIFQVKKGAVKSVDSMDLEVTVDGNTSLVRLAG